MLSHSIASWLNFSLNLSHQIAHSRFHRYEEWRSEASFVFLLINLNDALQVLKREGLEIDFTDDLPASLNVTDQVNKFRNIACHIKSGGKTFQATDTTFHFGTAGPSTPCAFMVNGDIFGCEFPDDFAFFYGPNRLLFRRHIRRAIREAVSVAKPLVVASAGRWIGP